jgi:hypothetical protein
LNKIVVHWQNGEITKGCTANFSPSAPKFRLTDLYDTPKWEEIRLDSLKALFFVKSFEGDFQHMDLHDFSNAPSFGKHIVVTFMDGERFYGTSEAVHPDATGFFIFPIDPDANTIRAFVINNFIDKVVVSD